MGEQNLGSAITVGSGIPLGVMYQLAKSQGKIFVGGEAATVVAAGGYVQGAGHSALSPTYGLAADNCLGILYFSLPCVASLLSTLIFRTLSGHCQWEPYYSE